MGMTLKELLTKGEGTISAKEAKALAAQCRMDEETLYTLLRKTRDQGAGRGHGADAGCGQHHGGGGERREQQR